MATIAIVGSRNFADLHLVRSFVQMLRPSTTIVSGGASGVDQTAADEAQKCGLDVRVIRPDYARYGRSAPLMRNGDIVKDADYVFAFWDGSSRGTRDALDKAEQAGVPWVVVAAGTDPSVLFKELP